MIRKSLFWIVQALFFQRREKNHWFWGILLKYTILLIPVKIIIFIIKVENVNDPIGPIEEILKKAKKNELLVHYKIPDFSTPHDFLVNVAMARGKLNKVYIFLKKNVISSNLGRNSRFGKCCESSFGGLEHWKNQILHNSS